MISNYKIHFIGIVDSKAPRKILVPFFPDNTSKFPDSS
ncbi:hypothetical protein HYQ56_2038 [Lactobacillus crispatus]|uniref:Transposase n=1 Tax=Lactobacillus crispatus TaxID=47770 RepID=A0AAW4DS81_9LACO|nr:hypothetical protein [Lactobacillus crispatus]